MFFFSSRKLTLFLWFQWEKCLVTHSRCILEKSNIFSHQKWLCQPFSSQLHFAGLDNFLSSGCGFPNINWWKSPFLTMDTTGSRSFSPGTSIHVISMELGSPGEHGVSRSSTTTPGLFHVDPRTWISMGIRTGIKNYNKKHHTVLPPSGWIYILDW